MCAVAAGSGVLAHGWIAPAGRRRGWLPLGANAAAGRSGVGADVAAGRPGVVADVAAGRPGVVALGCECPPAARLSSPGRNIRAASSLTSHPRATTHGSYRHRGALESVWPPRTGDGVALWSPRIGGDAALAWVGGPCGEIKEEAACQARE